MAGPGLLNTSPGRASPAVAPRPPIEAVAAERLRRVFAGEVVGAAKPIAHSVSIRLDVSGVSHRSPGEIHIQRWAGLSAVGATVLFAAANVLWAFEQPDPGASGPELVDFYGDLSERIVAGALLSLISIAIFVVFASAFRTVLIELEKDELLANIAFGGTLLGLAAGVGAETVNMAAALRAGDGELTEPLALALFDISYVLGSYAAGIGFGLLTLATGAAALRAGALLPRWLAVVALALGVALVTPLSAYTLGEYAIGPSLLLLLVLGVMLLRGSAVPAAPSQA